VKEHIEINKLQKANQIMGEIYQLQIEFKEKGETYHLLLDEFYKNIDMLSDRPLHLRIMKNKF